MGRRLFGPAACLGLFFLALTILPVLLMRWVDPFSSAFMLQSPVAVRYTWVDMKRISPNAALAVIAAEDQQFPFHHGFDMESIRKAVEHNNRSRRVRGASTISQQVAKNLFLWPGRSYLRKALEAWFTVLIELLWPKERILEVYLNVVEFGKGVYGVEAAARRFYHKPAARLSASEAALLAAVLPNPRRFRVERPSEYVMARRSWILVQMQGLGGVSYLRDVVGRRETVRRSSAST